MGPRPSDRGRQHAAVCGGDAQDGASMGPRPSDRGRPEEHAATASKALGLQWVHGLLTVGDRTCGRGCCGPTPRLQWVHGLLTVGDEPSRLSARNVAELQWVHGLLTVGDYHRPLDISLMVWPASMGPRPSDRGRRGGAAGQQGSEERASMGPRPSDRGRRAPETFGEDDRAVASMGPRPSDRGRPKNTSQGSALSKLQWVHGLLTVGDT